MIRVNIAGGLVHESEKPNLERWRETFMAGFPSGLGTDFLLGVFSAANFLFSEAMRVNDALGIGNTFELCGCAVLALEKRGYFQDCYTTVEKANLQAWAMEVSATHTKLREEEVTKRQEMAKSQDNPSWVLPDDLVEQGGAK